MVNGKRREEVVVVDQSIQLIIGMGGRRSHENNEADKDDSRIKTGLDTILAAGASKDGELVEFRFLVLVGW
jgi:hypothetical protein